MGIIYIISNSINIKLYIGLTTETLESRWKRHRNDAKKFAKELEDGIKSNKRFCVKLCRAMNKHGIDKFKIEKIDVEDDIIILKKLETEYIKQLDTVKNGYNIQSGGEHQTHNDKTKKIIGMHGLITATKRIDLMRTNDNVKGLPMRCIWNKQKQAFCINKHPHCKYKMFSITKYGSEEAAKKALLEFYHTLPVEIIPQKVITYSDSE